MEQAPEDGKDRTLSEKKKEVIDSYRDHISDSDRDCGGYRPLKKCSVDMNQVANLYYLILSYYYLSYLIVRYCYILNDYAKLINYWSVLPLQL